MNPILIQRHLTRIVTLTDSNYSSWKMKLQIALDYLDYNFVLSEDMPIFDPTTTDAQQAAAQVSIDKWVKPTRYVFS